MEAELTDLNQKMKEMKQLISNIGHRIGQLNTSDITQHWQNHEAILNMLREIRTIDDFIRIIKSEQSRVVEEIRAPYYAKIRHIVSIPGYIGRLPILYPELNIEQPGDVSGLDQYLLDMLGTSTRYYDLVCQYDSIGEVSDVDLQHQCKMLEEHQNIDAAIIGDMDAELRHISPGEVYDFLEKEHNEKLIEISTREHQIDTIKHEIAVVRQKLAERNRLATEYSTGIRVKNNAGDC